MGKRSEFVRLDKDAYQTIDKRAVASLLPFLSEVKIFAEPCYGEGKLGDQLEGINSMHCGWASDITMGQDALKLTSQDLFHCDHIITNPPWSRHILHPMIECFSKLKPTWLLFDSDWCQTKQSSIYMRELCTDIVSVGRLIWIPGTTMSGKDNCQWYKFDINKSSPTRFYGR